MEFYQVSRKLGRLTSKAVINLLPWENGLHVFPDLRAFWFLEKTALQENRVSGTVVMFQLTWNSRISTYIS